MVTRSPVSFGVPTQGPHSEKHSHQSEREIPARQRKGGLAPSGSGCPPRGPRSPDVICQARTPAASGAAASAPGAAATAVRSRTSHPSPRSLSSPAALYSLHQDPPREAAGHQPRQGSLRCHALTGSTSTRGKTGIAGRTASGSSSSGARAVTFPSTLTSTRSPK
jgi:hypothetical protein